MKIKKTKFKDLIVFKSKNYYDKRGLFRELALKNKTTLKEEAIKSGLIKEKDYDKIVNPKNMVQPAQDEIIRFVKFFSSIQFETLIPPLLNS